MKQFLSGVGVLMVLLGTVWLFFPEFALRQWNIEPDAAAVYIGRRCGGLLFGYAPILWLSRASGPSPARHAVLAGGTFVAGLMTLVSLLGVLSGVIGPTAWAAVVIEALLTVGFAYYAVTGARITNASAGEAR
jgi:hypothetical protein